MAFLSWSIQFIENKENDDVMPIDAILRPAAVLFR